MVNTTQSTVEELRAAGGMYAFLSHSFLKEPTAEELKELSTGLRGEHLREIGYDLLKGLKRKGADDQADALAVEYCRLFIGPGPHLSPHESVVRGEGRHWGKHTVEVGEVYKTCGFAMADDVREMPDHVGIELAFVAATYEQEISLVKRRATRKAAGVREKRAQFLRDHLDAWLPVLAREVSKNSTLAFYKGLAKLARDWVSCELTACTAVTPPAQRG